MTPEKLLQEWTSGEQTGMRPARVQTLRDDLMDATGQSIPRRIPEIAAFLDNAQWKGTITRKLRDAAESDGSDDS
jgi:hypothetical protein